ncbi:MAG: hypothetical protein EBR09_13105 [Proteobacteria bacterium]|jgi:hypothetical protein|nr:hypothetical protein [Pseudomonadota bacterium]
MASGGFFSGLSGGIRFTDSLINGPGPLPTDLRGGPQGVYGEADGVYNGTSQLLANIVPYSQPKEGNLNANRGPQTAHRVAAGVPCVHLPEPEPDTVSTFSLSHAVDNGDIAFIVTPISSQKFVWLSQKPYPTQSSKHLNALVHVSIFLNIVQVNYVLAGIFNRLLYMVEHNISRLENSNAWDSIICSFGTYAREFAEHIVDVCGTSSSVGGKRKGIVEIEEDKVHLFVMKTSVLLHHIIKFHIRPFGICAGSEKQGGQHEGRDKPVQAAASYFTTLTVDGQNRDLVNIWRNNEIEGGEQLILHLAPVTRSQMVLYTLNHYNHGTVSKYMHFNSKQLKNVTLQLIPMFFKAGAPPENYANELDLIVNLYFTESGKTEDQKNDIKKAKERVKLMFDYRFTGYWHCAQTHTKSARYGHILAPFNDHEYLNGALLQVNWAPVWKGAHVFDILSKDIVHKVNTNTRLDHKKNMSDSQMRLIKKDLEFLASWIDISCRNSSKPVEVRDNIVNCFLPSHITFTSEISSGHPQPSGTDAAPDRSDFFPQLVGAASAPVLESGEPPKKKRAAGVPKAARVPVSTKSAEELELERLFAE